jgi:hypothetical protein
MRKKETVWVAVILGLAMACGRVAAQDAGTASRPAAEKSADDKPKSGLAPITQYHLDFTLSEMEDGKKINSRQYSTNLATDEGNEIKIGTRVPVESKQGEFQYLDIGTSIFARIGEMRGETELTVRAEISSFAAAEPNQERDWHPIVRQLKMGGTVLLPITKTFVMGSADDPNSKRQFQLEVTVTKLK